MKKIVIILLSLIFILSFSGISFSQDVYVNGYFKGNGTYVKPHRRSAPNGNIFDNYSTRGNINPYTGKRGTVNPYKSSRSLGNYGQSLGSRNSNRGYGQSLGRTGRQNRLRGVNPRTGLRIPLHRGTGLQFPR